MTLKQYQEENSVLLTTVLSAFHKTFQFDTCFFIGSRLPRDGNGEVVGDGEDDWTLVEIQ